MRRYTSCYTNNVRVLMDLFNFSESKAEAYVRKHKKLFHKETSQIVDSYHFCKKIGYTNRDILKYSNLLIPPYIQHVQHFKSLEETGCNPIHPKLLSNPKLYMKRPISVFKVLKFLKAEINVADQFLQYINLPIEKPKELDKRKNILDDMLWTDIHKRILDEWLKARLDASDEDIIKLFRIHKMIKNKSFRVIEENIQLAESLGLDSRKILKCGYLLNNYPEYPKTVLRDFPNLAGLDMRAAMKTNPKLMMINPKNILKIYGLLKEHGISDEHIRKKHQIFTMNVDTIRCRLLEIKRHPELRSISDYINILHLIVHQKKINSRLSFMQELKLKCGSFQIFQNMEDKFFEDYIKEGKDVNLKADLIRFLSILFKKDKKEVSKIIYAHPCCQCVPFIDMEDTYNYLIKKGYTNESIFKAMYILLYPKSKIDEAIKTILLDPDADFYDLTQKQVLNLALYHMEKKHHFTGNGIWATTPPEDIVLE